MVQLFKFCLVFILFLGCSSSPQLGRIENIERTSLIAVTYKIGQEEYTKKFVVRDKESQDLKVGEIIKFNDYGFVGRVKFEQ